MSNNNKNNLNLLIIIFSLLIKLIKTECPNLCECKWKNGKETVVCLNANLTMIPLHLESTTQILDLTNNNLLTIIKNDEFNNANLLNLQKIYLSKCRLKLLERYSFRNLINLIELDLSYNLLTIIPTHIFDSIIELRELKLNGNPIKKIFNNSFINIPQLIRLELSNCLINSIEKFAFYGLETSLEWLKLDKNKLIEINSNSLINLNNLHGLELASNPWNCTCILRPLREWMLKNNVPYNIPPICHYPKRLYLKSWDKLDLDEFACLPQILPVHNHTYGIEGNNITMKCSIDSIPQPSIRWLFKNKIIANLSTPTTTSTTNNNYDKKLYMVNLKNNSTNLTIFTTDLQDNGIYVCLAENKAGRSEATITLSITKKLSDNYLNNKLIIASIITIILFILISFLITLCIYSIRKKQLLIWHRHRHHHHHHHHHHHNHHNNINHRDCYENDNNYEKIEMNSHNKLNSNNTSGNNSNNISIVTNNRRNGDYSVVPIIDDDLDDIIDNDNNDNLNPVTSTTSTKNWNSTITATNDIEKRWNSPEHLLDPEDLHIPRRTLQEARDDIKKTFNSTSGTFNYYQQEPSTSSNNYCNNNNNNNSNNNNKDDELIQRYPDLLENSKYNNLINNNNNLYKFNSITSINKANSDGDGSINDITELFCTLPRKKKLLTNKKYKSNDSQSPLLPLSDCHNYSSNSSNDSYTNYHHPTKFNFNATTTTTTNRVLNNKLSNSFLNLSIKDDQITAQNSSTPLLDISSLENRILSSTLQQQQHSQKLLSSNHNHQNLMNDQSLINHQSNKPYKTNNSSYDYHAIQLERFLEEYRNLQKQLNQMKETCDNLKNQSSTASASSSSSVPAIKEVPAVTTATISKNVENNMTSDLLLKNDFPPQSPDQILLENSIDFRNFENELTKYLIEKNPKLKQTFNNNTTTTSDNK